MVEDYDCMYVHLYNNDPDLEQRNGGFPIQYLLVPSSAYSSDGHTTQKQKSPPSCMPREGMDSSSGFHEHKFTSEPGTHTR